MTTNRPLRVFLCHSSADKPAVRELYQKLRAEPWIQPWLDEEDIFPGDDWNLEIQRAIRETDAIIVCLSKGSITKEGYVQREIKTALDFSDEKPEGMVYIIPIRLEECKPPQRLSKWQYADYFEGNRERALQRLLVSLKRRADSLDLQHEQLIPSTKKKPIEVRSLLVEESAPKNRFEEVYDHARKDLSERYERIQKGVSSKVTEDRSLISQTEHPTSEWIDANKITLSNGMELMRVPAGKFLMGEGKEQHTIDIPYDYWMARYLVTNALYNQFKKKDFDKGKEDHPVVGVLRNDVMEYCKWLNKILNSEIQIQNLQLRLPTEAEWEKAARGTDGRKYSWGNDFDKNKCNTSEGEKGGTTPVGLYSPRGDSPYGCADMSGNVWEWMHNLFEPYPYQANDGREDEKASGSCVLRGGSYIDWRVPCARRHTFSINDINNTYYQRGFRVVMAPNLS